MLADRCESDLDAVALVTAVRADVRVFSKGHKTSRSVASDDLLYPEDRIDTGQSGGIQLRYCVSNIRLGLSSDTTIVLPKRPEDPAVTLSAGLMRFISSLRKWFEIKTPLVVAGIEGTEAVVVVDGAEQDTLLLVREGTVVSTSRRQGTEIRIRPGEAIYASQSASMMRATSRNVPPKFRGYLVDPAGASDWAVYYPPIVLAKDTRDPQIGAAARALSAGDPDDADRLLRAVAADSADRGLALALRSVAATFRNRTAEGLRLAEEAVVVEPDKGAPHIALSYAQQAAGEIETARVSARRAVEIAPHDAYAWARLAELALVLGDGRAASDAVAASLAIEETALGRAIEGFAKLARNNTGSAIMAFDRSITIDSWSPLPRLGRGLALIRDGEIATGRAELEAAAALDPRRASLRTWLGRAYSEEGLGAKALAQFGLALEEDPDDPTPALFKGYELFVQNRPIESLRALEQARSLAKGRVTVRGRRGLAEDQAVQRTALGRTYDALGFAALATQEAARAVDAHPASPAAQRFLFDAYRGRPGFEIAQTSQLMRYQLLLPPSTEPVQPSLSEADLGLLTVARPARPTFHEFAPLFEANGIYLFGSGAVGNNGVLGDELSFSLLKDNFSISAGQFHLETEGFRPNDEVTHDVVSVLAKLAPVPEVTLTGEVRWRRTEQGNRFLRAIDDDRTGRTVNEAFDNVLYRLGAHARSGSGLDLLAAATYASFESENATQTDFGFFQLKDTRRLESDSLDLELQAIQQIPFGHVTAGASFTRIQGDRSSANEEVDYPLSFFEEVANEDLEQFSLYLYGNFRPIETVDVVMGLSYEYVDFASRPESTTDPTGEFLAFFDRDEEVSQLNPKIGIRFEPLEGFALRAAYARTLKRDLVADQTLEPTTLAGFNQFFDDQNRTEAEMVAGGADLRVLPNLWVGAEYVVRGLDIPGVDAEGPGRLRGDERTARGYANSTLGDRWALSASLEHSSNDAGTFGRPGEVETLLVPFTAGYYHPSGFFTTAQAIVFDQTSFNDLSTTRVRRDESGVLVNGAVGFRFRRNRGLLSLEINNLLDEELQLENSLNNSARPSTRPIAESFNIIGRVTLAF